CRCHSGPAMDLNSLLLRALDLGASDVHLKIGEPPVVRRDGSLERMDADALTPEDLETVLHTVTSTLPGRVGEFEVTGELDLAYSAPDLPRFRVNGFRQRGAISFAFRAIPDQVPTFDKLRLPPGVRRLA